MAKIPGVLLVVLAAAVVLLGGRATSITPELQAAAIVADHADAAEYLTTAPSQDGEQAADQEDLDEAAGCRSVKPTREIAPSALPVTERELRRLPDIPPRLVPLV